MMLLNLLKNKQIELLRKKLNSDQILQFVEELQGLIKNGFHFAEDKQNYSIFWRGK